MGQHLALQNELRASGIDPADIGTNLYIKSCCLGICITSVVFCQNIHAIPVTRGHAQPVTGVATNVITDNSGPAKRIDTISPIDIG